ncbi:MAG: hypothetical protein KIS87_09765 [Phycisphaeraceae bacterium]|nr:hypothetical protein [Phycisphaeraceae bacterium]
MPGMHGTRRHHDRLLAAWLARADAPCPVCGYCLHGLRTARCPECATPLQLSLASSNLRKGPWTLAVVSFALALGFDGVVTVLLLVALALSPSPRLQPFGVVTAFGAMSAACLGGLLLLIHCAKAWVRVTPRAQWARAWAAFVLVGLGHAAFGIALWATLK